MYRIGSLHLDPDGVATRDGVPLRLSPKEFGLLCLLARSGGRVVSREQILEELWPDEFASDESLTRCVYSLRRRLGSDRRLVATVPKRGLRLAVPVRPERSPRASTTEKAAQASPQAYAHYLEAQRECNRPGPAAAARAAELFEAAARVDPQYAMPLAAIGELAQYQANRGYLLPVDAERRAMDACERALAIDPNLAAAHSARGWHQALIRRDVEGGLASIDTALEIDPEYARAHHFRAFVLRSVGSKEAAAEATRAALKLDPHAYVIAHGSTFTLFFAGHAEEGLEIARKACETVPYADIAHGFRTAISAWLGLREESLAAARETDRTGGNDPGVSTFVAYALARAGLTDEARERADQAAASRFPRAPRGLLAAPYAALGDLDQAARYLREARQERCPWFLGARFDPRLAPVLDDPRLRDLWDE